jgi:agmatine deiminase
MYLPAEWEQQEFVLLAYPHENTDWNQYLDEAKESFNTLVLTIAKYQRVVLITKDKTKLPTEFIKNQNIEFVVYESNDTWARDFGAITLKGKRNAYLDFVFTGWGDKFEASRDNEINSILFNEEIINSLSPINFILEGGSIESNGDGVLLTTTECLLNQNRNSGQTKEDVEAKLKKELYVEKVLWLENGYLEGDDTDSHIDMLARFVAKDTIVYVKCNDENDPHYEALSKMEEELQNLTDKDGNSFKLVGLPWVGIKTYDDERLPCSYANFLIINGAVIVPQYGDKNDKLAIKVLEKQFSDREVVGVDSLVFIRQHGSIHCLSMNFYSNISDN